MMLPIKRNRQRGVDICTSWHPSNELLTQTKEMVEALNALIVSLQE